MEKEQLLHLVLQVIILVLIFLHLHGTAFIAIANGKITFCQFLGGGGYTITLSFDNFKVTYCHCDPNFIVSVGQEVKQGEIIGYVGPKYVYGVAGNQYKDENRKTNKWSHYWAPFTSWY